MTAKDHRTRSPDTHLHGFTHWAREMVIQDDMIASMVKSANTKLYNLRNQVDLYYIHIDDLKQVKASPT